MRRIAGFDAVVLDGVRQREVPLDELLVQYAVHVWHHRDLLAHHEHVPAEVTVCIHELTPEPWTIVEEMGEGSRVGTGRGDTVAVRFGVNVVAETRVVMVGHQRDVARSRNLHHKLAFGFQVGVGQAA
jgi:hypothetical protein